MRKSILSVIVALGVVNANPSITTAAPKTYGDIPVNRILSVHDGDTILVSMDSVHPLIGNRISVRIRGIDTPEIMGRCTDERNRAYAAREFVKKTLTAAKVVTLRDVGRDKYFRVLADIDIDGADLGPLILEEGFGRPYAGGKKQTWCP